MLTNLASKFAELNLKNSYFFNRQEVHPKFLFPESLYLKVTQQNYDFIH